MSAASATKFPVRPLYATGTPDELQFKPALCEISLTKVYSLQSTVSLPLQDCCDTLKLLCYCMGQPILPRETLSAFAAILY